MENYKLVGIKKHKSKAGNEYYIAYILYENDYSFEVLTSMITNKQVQPLMDVIGDDTFELDRFLKPTFNSFQKKYQLTINYGL